MIPSWTHPPYLPCLLLLLGGDVGEERLPPREALDDLPQRVVPLRAGDLRRHEAILGGRVGVGAGLEQHAGRVAPAPVGREAQRAPLLGVPEIGVIFCDDLMS